MFGLSASAQSGAEAAASDAQQRSYIFRKEPIKEKKINWEIVLTGNISENYRQETEIGAGMQLTGLYQATPNWAFGLNSGIDWLAFDYGWRSIPIQGIARYYQKERFQPFYLEGAAGYSLGLTNESREIHEAEGGFSYRLSIGRIWGSAKAPYFSSSIGFQEQRLALTVPNGGSWGWWGETRVKRDMQLQRWTLRLGMFF